MPNRPVLVFTQGDPAGIGPEILLKATAHPQLLDVCRLLVIAERSAIAALRPVMSDLNWDSLCFFDQVPDLETVSTLDGIAILDPVGSDRTVEPGRPGAADARGALAALDLGIELTADGPGAALITAPLNKAEIARHIDPDFRGHTDYLAEKAGLTVYGDEYLMAFLAPSLRVALLSTHISLLEAIDRVTEQRVLAALRCMARHTSGRIIVAGLDPHAGEGGLIGTQDDEAVRPAIEQARAEGIDAHGPQSADSLFARAIDGACDWVLALYHDQGLIGVKTAAFGDATNWTLGLPYLRTSVDHGTAYDIAGKGEADSSSLQAVLRTTLELISSSAVD